MATPQETKPLQQPPCLIDCLLGSTAVGTPAASPPCDGSRLERLSTPHLVAAAENELRQVERLGGAAANPHWPNGDGPLADRLFEEEEAKRLVSSELLSELSEPPMRQSCHGNQDRYRLEELVTSRSQQHRSALAQLRGLSSLPQLPGLSELSGRASPEPSEPSEPSGRAMDHATGQDAALVGCSSFLGGLQVYSALHPPQRRPEEGGFPGAEAELAFLALDANDEALIAEIAEMACGE